MTAAVPLNTAVPELSLAAAAALFLSQQPSPRTLVGLQRRPWEYATSARLELLTCVLADGSTWELVLKHVGRSTTSQRALRVKPGFVIDPNREIATYRTLLEPLSIGPGVVGTGALDGGDVQWLLLERVSGRPLYEDGALETWMTVAGWLARTHATLQKLDLQRVRDIVPMIEYDRIWYRTWMDRALQFFTADDPPASRHGRSALRWLAARYDAVVDRLLSLPRTIVHGEFYPSNVLVSGTGCDLRVYPVDWEMTAVAPAVIDLAALTSGTWDDRDRRRVIAEYSASAGADEEQLVEAVAWAQIHLAVQWLGWFGRRRTPSWHARDWLSDAVERAEALGL